MAEEIAVENERISNFQGLVNRDLGSGHHTAYRRESLIDLYLHVHAKFRRNLGKFLWTDV